ncbi:nuclear transcription factor Y subunit B-4-like [Prosopis cineraria]|uniref:nuclear transcription factor Y subunit B-4-like n=1 Tax=Prosopis cineraria TaxID=364024 RepID=UPI00240F1B92|nr:nuclear transcription factor Y subunit B-4-like [Prosopis cineraria]
MSDNSEREGFNKYSFNNTGAFHHHQDGEVIKEQDRLLPIANVGRIMKQILPPNAKISKEAKETMQECVSEFISFVTGEASDKCHKEKRKTVNGDDICWALATLGFDDYAEPLKRYLLKFRESEGERSNQNKGYDLHTHETNTAADQSYEYEGEPPRGAPSGMKFNGTSHQSRQFSNSTSYLS